MKKVLILDFGGQYNLLIARRVRECNVYCELRHNNISMDEVRAFAPDAVILTGGPATVSDPDAPKMSREMFDLGVPMLGICYGQQLISYMLGGTTKRGAVREYGKTALHNLGKSVLMEGVPADSICWMSHTVVVDQMPEGFTNIAVTDDCQTAAIE